MSKQTAPADRLLHRMLTPLWVRYHNWEGHVRSERWGFSGERTLYICACGAERLK